MTDTGDGRPRGSRQLFRASGALRDGHFLLKSGRHGDRYLEKFQVLQYPEAVVELCGYLARLGAMTGTDDRRWTSWSARPLAACSSRSRRPASWESAGIFAEEVRDPDGGAHRELRRGFAIGEGERVYLVDDILTTGGSLLAMLPAVESTPGVLVATSVIVDRSGGTTEVISPASGRSYPVSALWTLDVPTYEPGPSICAACAAGEPLMAPGSTGTKPTRG